MKTNLGISIYPEIIGKEKTIAYIDLANKYGFTRVFANLLEMEDNEEGNKKLKTLSEIYNYAKNKGFEVIVDVNPNFYKAFNLPKTEIDFFCKLNVSGIRLDEDFGGEFEAQLSNNSQGLKIELNASASTKTIDATLEKGGNPQNLIACHNFYPMKFTGLAEERFIQLSSHFRAKGIRVKAFITLPEEQKGIGPWNINEGMPTLEKHRNMILSDQLKDLLAQNLVDDIIISQQGATEEQFKEMHAVLDKIEKIKRNTIDIFIKYDAAGRKIEKDIIFNNQGKTHFNRNDYNDFFIRSTIPRIDYKYEEIKPYQSGKVLKPGDVVILNENMGRYKGELHIITKELKDYNNSRNLAGRVLEDEMWKLPFIKGGIKFKIIDKII